MSKPESPTPDPPPIEVDPIRQWLVEEIDRVRAKVPTAPFEDVHAELTALATALPEKLHIAEQARRRFQAPARPARTLGGAINRLVEVDATARRQAEQRQQAEARRAALAPVAAQGRQILDEQQELQAGPRGAEMVRLESINTNELRAQVRQELWHKVDRLERLRRDLRSSLAKSVITLTRIPARIAALSVRDLTSTERFPMSLADAIRADVQAQAGVPHTLEEGLAEAARLIEDITKEIVSAPPPRYTKLAPAPSEDPTPTEEALR